MIKNLFFIILLTGTIMYPKAKEIEDFSIRCITGESGTGTEVLRYGKSGIEVVGTEHIDLRAGDILRVPRPEEELGNKKQNWKRGVGG